MILAIDDTGIYYLFVIICAVALATCFGASAEAGADLFSVIDGGHPSRPIDTDAAPILQTPLDATGESSDS